MRVLLPEPAETTVDESLADYEPGDLAGDGELPFIATNFVSTLDGRATIAGRATPIGSDTDLAMLFGLRSRFGAVMIGAQTMRIEPIGRLVPDADVRARRERRGLSHDPLAVLLTGSMDIPWDAPLFTNGGGRVLIFTGSDKEAPETATSLRVVRQEAGDDRVNLRDAMKHLRQERGVRSVLCEGGPHVLGEMVAEDLIDEVFLTIAPKLSGGSETRILEGDLPEVRDMELVWLLEEDGELFTRWRRA
jgi:5-amino-6-(5-phosphoribosylamino)uracil reductase